MTKSIKLMTLLIATTACGLTTIAARQPNFIVILTDDQGYGDLSCYGAKDLATPKIDQMAKEGTRVTSFYVSPDADVQLFNLAEDLGQRVNVADQYPERVGKRRARLNAMKNGAR